MSASVSAADRDPHLASDAATAIAAADGGADGRVRHRLAARRGCVLRAAAASRPAFLPFAGAFAAAQLTGLASHVPGGLGVFDGLMVLFLRNRVPIAALATALVAYRIVYYLVPLAVALAMLLMDETSQRRRQLSQFRRTCHALASWATPRVLALFTFASGVVLLFSGATPAVPSACSGWRPSCRCRCWKPRTSPPA